MVLHTILCVCIVQHYVICIERARENESESEREREREREGERERERRHKLASQATINTISTNYQGQQSRAGLYTLHITL